MLNRLFYLNISLCKKVNNKYKNIFNTIKEDIKTKIKEDIKTNFINTDNMSKEQKNNFNRRILFSFFITSSFFTSYFVLNKVINRRNPNVVANAQAMIGGYFF